MADELQPYAPAPRQLAENLWIWDGEWYDTPLKRRMTIARLESGGLFIHNAIALKDGDYAVLDRLGPVEVIVAPNAFHGSDAHVYKLRYPSAKLFVARGLGKAVGSQCDITGMLPAAWPSALSREIACHEFAGLRLLNENVFFHAASRTLIVTDLVFHMQNDPKGAEKAFFRWNLIYKRFGPSRIFKWVFLKNRSRAKRSLETLLQWDFDRVIMNHGEVLEAGGKAAMTQGFREIGVI